MPKWPEGKTAVLGLMIPWELWPDDLGSSKAHQRVAQRPLPATAKYDRDMWAVYDHMYGERHGLRRVMDVLDEWNVKASVMANGKRVESHPDLAREAAKRGHDMGSENYLHEYAVTYDAEGEKESLVSTVKAFEGVLGAQPTGYVSPGHRPTPNTVRLLMELGYRWDADFMYADAPFIIDGGERQLVGMAYAHISDYHTYSMTGRTPREIHEMLLDQMRALRREGSRGQPGMMGYAIHPYISQGFRTEMLYDFLGEVSKMDDVWIATRSEVADWVLDNRADFHTVALAEIEAEFPAS